MPAKNTNSKQTAKTTPTPAPVVAETTPAQKGGKKVVAKVEETPAPAPVVEATPAKPQKGGKKSAKVEETPAPVVEATPAKPQKGGKKVVAKVEETPAPAPVVEATPAKPQKGGKKAVEKVEETPAPVVAVGGAKTKKAAGKKPAEKPVEKETEEVEAEESTDRKIRSFKVKLPGSEDYEGRFTGLTPYQAANKALSKYFRETKKPLAEITFSICESTRKSRKATYTYVGRRQKLDTPVTYKINDEKKNEVREIVKNFKNTLKKVKKSESSNDSA